MLTSSLRSHWLNDSFAANGDGLVVATTQALKRKRHTPYDDICLPVAMVEVMDDSIMIAGSFPVFHCSTRMLETVQSAYGSETNWDKSAVFLHNVPNPPTVIYLPSVEPANPSVVTTHPVNVYSSHIELMRVSMNDPELQFQKLTDLISGFQFPTLHLHLPFTALQHILSQCLIARIRPRLAFHPISQDAAHRLDCLIAQKVYDYLRFPFQFNSALLSLPLSDFGFGFPSISHLNDMAAINGLFRDLNHHLSMFHNMALITLADWTCALNDCQFPLHGKSLSSLTSRRHPCLPFPWLVAQSALSHLNISIHDTDLSYLFHGDISLVHLNKLLPHTKTVPHHHLTNLANADITTLRQLASFPSPSSLSITSPPCNPLIPLQTVLYNHTFNDDTEDRLSVGGVLENSSATGSDLSMLALPHCMRKEMAEEVLHACLYTSPHDSFASPSLPGSWATDGSMIPVTPGFQEPRSVTFSAISGQGSVAFSLDLFRTSANIGLGETYGLVATNIYGSNSHLHSPQNSHDIYIDHLNSERIIASARCPSFQHYQWSSLPGRSLYRWLLYNITHPINNTSIPTIKYTPAHTDSTTPPSLLNNAADLLATTSQNLTLRPFPAPVPTFFMDHFVIYSETDSYIESNVSKYLSNVHASLTIMQPDFRPALTMMMPLYRPCAPPEHPYICASSAFSAVIQLYARSSQLDCCYTRFLRFGDISPTCTSGCPEIETIHHIFVTCPEYDAICDEVAQQLHAKTSKLLHVADTPLSQCIPLLELARNLFKDGPHWPHHSAQFYLGLLPPFPHEILDGPSPMTHSQTHIRIAHT
ncbi:uncharacterized protein EV420DRAFT_1303188 [Desarmillaria tabescens]|uniref:Uncharacterized protein n=1 Tax=Armillaria tabescens TaxID=1929756 RepID=A0AA39NG12_ARMTA|nr:uncharacterized protein EV420DRAFT_1303188 [Desarmillaria tabescens]KAK0464798.1 hypothetical protein EV420DRAFT_1303188 [Desarmillaria tabescens]